jgi:hypothetical protein
MDSTNWHAFFQKNRHFAPPLFAVLDEKMKSYSEETKKYIEKLYDRRQGAEVVTRYEMKGGNWQPQLKLCHENVDAYIKNTDGFKAARGWLYFDLQGFNYVMFVQHSVLESPEGQLMEITPSDASQEYPFIRAYESDEEFFEKENHTENGKLYYYE